MNKKERVFNAVNGKKVDKLPYAIWTHLPGIDLDPEKLADYTSNFVEKYDTDIVKTMNNGMYAVEDYGVKVDYSEVSKGGVARVVTTVIENADDWGRIRELELDKAEALNREIHSLKKTLKLVENKEIPVIFTVFSPFTTAYKLSNARIIEHIRTSDTRYIHQALQMITDTTAKLVRKVNRLGCAGIFFASQLSSHDVCDEDVFREFGAFYDKQVLLASEGYCDVVHAHGTNIMYDILREYPADVFNWHVWESEPSLETAREMEKCIMGGIVRSDITNSNYDAIDRQIKACWDILQGRHHILSPGCVIRYPLNDEALAYVRQAKNRICR